MALFEAVFLTEIEIVPQPFEANSLRLYRDALLSKIDLVLTGNVRWYRKHEWYPVSGNHALGSNIQLEKAYHAKNRLSNAPIPE
jgi:hypothetical protein